MTRKLPKSVKSEEFIRLIKAIPEKDKGSKVAFLLAYGSGLRVSEVTKLNRTNVDSIRKIIHIVQSKGGVDRTVPLPKGWKTWMLNVIPLGVTTRTLERRFVKYRIKANLSPMYTFHSLRHGFATRLVEKNVPLNQIQVLLGHSDISTTGIYTKARPQDALENYEKLF